MPVNFEASAALLYYPTNRPSLLYCNIFLPFILPSLNSSSFSIDSPQAHLNPAQVLVSPEQLRLIFETSTPTAYAASRAELKVQIYSPLILYLDTF